MHGPARRIDILTPVAAVAVVVAVFWLGPLMLDQLVLFGDRQQTESAAAARTLMPIPAMILAAGSLGIGMRGLIPHAFVAAIPLAAVALALAAPDTAFSIAAYGFSAPPAIGAALAAVLPIRGRAAGLALLLAIGAGVAMLLLIESIMGLLVTLAVIAWLSLSRWSRPSAAAAASAVD